LSLFQKKINNSKNRWSCRRRRRSE